MKRDTRNVKRKGLVDELQPAQRTQRKKDDRLVDELAQVTVQSQVLDMLRNGHTLLDIAQRLSISPTVVRKEISASLAAHQESVSDHAEYVYTVNYLRLEGIFSQAMGAAFGSTTSYADKKSKDATLNDRERQWAQLALNVLKEQNKMAEVQLKYLKPGGGKDDDNKRGAKTEIYAPTIIAGDSMFQKAQSQLSDSFMKAHGHRLTALDEGDLDIQDVLLMELKAPEHITPAESVPAPEHISEEVLSDKVRGIEENFERLQQHLIETDDDDRS